MGRGRFRWIICSGSRVVEGEDRERETWLSGQVVDAAIQVHRVLGPGLLESAYEHCLAYELGLRGIEVGRQVALPIRYGDAELEAGYRLDLVVGRCVVVEIKAVEAFSRLHQAQILTYLKLSGYRVGLLLNFNVPVLRDGIRRFRR